MAERKPLFMSDEGFSEQMDPSADSMTLGGLTLGGDIAMGDNNITGMAAGVNDADAITKAQLDQAIISGGTTKEILLCPQQLNNTDGIYSAMLFFLANQPVSGDLVAITDGTVTREYAAVAGGDVQFAIGATVADTMANLAAAIDGDVLAEWGSGFSDALSSINTDGTIGIYMDATTVGVATMRVYGTFVTQADLQVVEYSDGTTADLDYQNSTSSTAVTTDPGDGRSGFQSTQAELEAGELHYIRCTDETYSWDADDQVWHVSSGSASIPDATSASGGGLKGKVTADEDFGLVITSGILKIDLEPSSGLEFVGGDLAAKADTAAGIELTAAGIGIDLAVSSPGLQFDGSGDLQAKPAPNGGIQVTANGIEVKLDDTPDTLDVDADGLKVVGVPLQFKINDVATGAAVTANNLDLLTNGSNADALHVHSGADEAERVEKDIEVDSSFNAGDPAYWTSTGNRVSPADAGAVSTSLPFAVARLAQATVGQTAPFVSDGACIGVLSSATPGTKYYLAAGTGLSAVRPGGAGNRIIQMGYAMNATDLWVEIQDYGRL